MANRAKLLGAVAVLVGCGVCAMAAGDDRKMDAGAIRGKWKVVSAKESQGDAPNADVAEYKDSVWMFEEKEFTITRTKTKTKLAYALDPAKKPKQIDLGPDLRGKNENRPFEGIYTLNGDKLTICFTVFNVRPTDFSMGRGIAAVKRLVVLERVQDAGKK
jgi:uncharacterized protein (TIGR03067 family)